MSMGLIMLGWKSILNKFFFFFNIHLTMTSQWEKGNRDTMESIKLNIICATNNHHLVICSKNKTKVAQLTKFTI
jgi:hypothetical protein